MFSTAYLFLHVLCSLIILACFVFRSLIILHFFRSIIILACFSQPNHSEDERQRLRLSSVATDLQFSPTRQRSLLSSLSLSPPRTLTWPGIKARRRIRPVIEKTKLSVQAHKGMKHASKFFSKATGDSSNPSKARSRRPSLNDIENWASFKNPNILPPFDHLPIRDATVGRVHEPLLQPSFDPSVSIVSSASRAASRRSSLSAIKSRSRRNSHSYQVFILFRVN